MLNKCQGRLLKKCQGEGSQPQPQEESGSVGKDKAAEEESRKAAKKSQGEIRGKESRFFIHLTKITITTESRMTLMHSTSFEEEQEEAEELPGINEYEEETSFDDYEEEGEVPSDPAFNVEFKKQQQDLKRKEGELEKISQVITKKAELLKAENEEKQRLHNPKVQ